MSGMQPCNECGTLTDFAVSRRDRYSYISPSTTLFQSAHCPNCWYPSSHANSMGGSITYYHKWDKKLNCYRHVKEKDLKQLENSRPSVFKTVRNHPYATRSKDKMTTINSPQPSQPSQSSK